MDTCHDAKCISKCLVNIKMALKKSGRKKALKTTQYIREDKEKKNNRMEEKNRACGRKRGERRCVRKKERRGRGRDSREERKEKKT